MSLRVVNLGLPKTGTTTLARAMKMSGFKVADHRIRAKQTPVTEIHDAFVGDLMYRGYFETGDPAAHIPGFDAIAEMSLLRKGRSLWPQMRFRPDRGDSSAPITDVQSSWPHRRDRLRRSRNLCWPGPIWAQARLPREANIPGLPAKAMATRRKQRIQWIEGHYSPCCAVIFSADDPGFLEYDIGRAWHQGAPEKRVCISAFPCRGGGARIPIRVAAGGLMRHRPCISGWNTVGGIASAIGYWPTTREQLTLAEAVHLCAKPGQQEPYASFYGGD